MLEHGVLYSSSMKQKNLERGEERDESLTKERTSEEKKGIVVLKRGGERDP